MATIFGSMGDDQLHGTSENDIIWGGPTKDTLVNAGNDTIYGENGHDVLYGTAGNTYLNGDNPGQYSDEGDGGNVLYGGNGNDVLFIHNGDFVDGGLGNNIAELYFDPAYSTPLIVDQYSAHSSNFSSVMFNIQSIDFRGGSGSDSVQGGSGNNTLNGGGGHDTLVGGVGNDSISLGNDGGLIQGGDGADLLRGGAGDDTISGGSGWDVIYGSLGNDSIDGGANPGGFMQNQLNYAQFSLNMTITLTGSYSGTAVKGAAVLPGFPAPTDIFTNILQYYTGSGADSLTGFSGQSNGGVVEFHPGAGNDTINGNFNQQNQADYSDALTGVVVNLGANTATDGFGGTDTLLNVLRVRGSSFADSITGSTNGEIFSASGGNDSYNGIGGNDFLDYAWISGPVAVTFGPSGYSGTVVKSGFSAGTDTFTNIRGAFGTTGADTLIGSTDSTAGLPFSVYLRGQAGNDFIDGVKSQLNAAAYGNSAAGVVVHLQTSLDSNGNWFGSAQDGYGTTDTLKNVVRAQGSAFNDSIYGTDKSDRFDATQGNDYYNGQGSFDTLDYGGLSSIVATSNAPLAGLYGYGTATVVKNNGFGGTDTLDGVNEIRGTIGNDMLYGVNAAYSWNGMRMRGGAGNDTIQGYRSGSNAVDYQNASAAVTIDMQTSGPDGNGDWVGTATGNSSVGTDTLLDVVRVRASNFNDTISGTSGNDIFGTFYAGSHTFYGRGGVNEVRLENSSPVDVVIDLGTTASGTGYGGYVGSITKPGGQVDTLYDFNRAQGGGGNDSIYGTPGDDTLSGGLGNNLMDGRGGSNWVTYRNFSGQNVPTHGTTIDLTHGTAISLSDGTDTLVNIQNAIGTQFADEITGLGVAGVATYVRGDGGNDILRAIDTYTMVTADYITSLSGITANLGTGVVSDDGWFGGHDYLINIHAIRGSNFADSITGGDYADTLSGGGGDDTLLGVRGGDVLNGGAGNDSLSAGGAGDTLAGGAGDDSYYVRFASDLVVEAAGQGIDTIYSRVSLTLAANVENLTLTVGATAGTGNELDNLLTGSGRNDTLLGLDGNDTLLGNAGHDSLDGGAGNDSLVGGAGNDALSGGDGNDTLVGGAGHDKLRGGAGFDIFRFVEPAGNETIADFMTAIDRIELSASLFVGAGLVAGAQLSNSHFAANAHGHATAATAQFVYDTSIGKLWWDADGSGAGGHVLVAALTGNPNLHATDIWGA